MDKVTKRFGRAKALDALTLHVAPGERLALVGANGAGKTTLFRCLLGEYVHEGDVRLDGRDPRRERTAALKAVSFVPQLPPPLKTPVGELVAFTVGVCGADAAAIRGVAGELGLDIKELGARPFAKLSGGQKQKLLIALALARPSRLFVLDEPAANLDPLARAVLFDLLAARRDAAMIVSSHRIDEVAALGARIVELDRGRVAYDERRIDADVAAAPLHARVRLARLDPAFARAVREWAFVASPDGLRWIGEVAGPDRLRFLNLLARYAAIVSEVRLDAESATETRHEDCACCG